MKSCIAVLVGALAVSAQAATHTCYVGAGETKSVSDFGYTFATGDTLEKTGPGRLNAVNNTTVAYNIDVKEGVYYVADGVYQKGGASLWVRKGATVNLGGATTGAFSGDWYVFLAGDGVGTGDNLGAFCMGGGNMNNAFGTASKFYLSDAATIYSYGTMNAVFSGSSASNGSTLYMDGHTLTIRGKTSTSVFRPRWKWIIDKPGKFIVKNGQFSRHKTTNEFSANIPSFTFTDGAQMQGFTDQSMWNKVDAFYFDYGTKIIKGGNGEAANPMTLNNVTGPVAISADEKVTLKGTYTARGADLAAEHILTSATTLTFAEGCKLTISDAFAKCWTKGTAVTIATAQTITGTPTIDPSQADLFTVANSGKAITVTPQFTVRSLADWGVLPGAENAEANAAAIASNVGSLEAGDYVAFPAAGDYYFGDYLDLSGVKAANVTLMKLSAATDAVNVHSTIKVGAAANFAVEGLTVRDVAGPLVVATDTAGLVLKDLAAYDVVGTYGEKAYPFVMDGVTGLEVTGFKVAHSAGQWDDTALFAGAGSQTEASEVRQGEIVATVLKGGAPDAGNRNWYQMYYVMSSNILNLANAAYSNKTFVVSGNGATIDGGVNLADLGVTNLVVKCGQYVVRSDEALGVDKSPVEVKDGGALTFATDKVAGRTIRFEGNGLSDDTPAIRFTGRALWDKAYYVTYELTGDATMYNNCTGECGTFCYSKVKTNGHTLTLKGVANSNYRFGRDCEWTGGGEVIVKSGVTLSASSKGGSGYRTSDVLIPKFTFEGTAKFLPDNADIFGLVKDCAFANTATLATKSGVSGVAATFSALKGAPVVADSIASVTVTGTYLANKADLAKDKYLAMKGAFVWGADAVADVDSADGVKDKVLVKAEGGITRKPKAGDVLKAAGYAVLRSDATTQCIGDWRGLMLFVR